MARKPKSAPSKKGHVGAEANGRKKSKPATPPARVVDWEAIEPLYRAGQISVRAIASQFGITEAAIRKKAKLEGWQRALADKVRRAVREKLVRGDGSQSGTHEPRATDADVVEKASLVGFEVATSHRRDIQQLHALKRILADRLAQHLHSEPPDGPFMGEKETPGDLLEKLARVTSRLIPLERQAYNLDETKPESSIDKLLDAIDGAGW